MTFDLSSLGWDDAFTSAYAQFDRRDHRPARVVRVDRGVCSILSAAGAGRASAGGALLAAAAADPVQLPCAGDWVVVRTWPDARTTVEAVLPRRTAVVRATAGREAAGQVLAANIDTAAAVVPVDPEPDLGRTERLLALAHASGARPVVIVTKIDLAPDPDAVVGHVATVAPGVSVYGVSAATGVGLAALRPLVAPGRTLGLLGHSGAGKSTLVNSLVGAVVMGTQEIRRADGRGRHTTTFRALVPIPAGGAVLDTPGLRAVGLVGADIDGLALAFADIEALVRRCRFGDCAHQAEPGCAVTAALATGELSGRRLESWRRLRAEVERERHRRVARFAAEERAARRRRHAQFRLGRRRA
jgi:ribosome biogenesis GTPase